MNNSAIAAAKRRRAGAPPVPAPAPAASCSVPPRQQQQQQQQPIPSTHKILSLKEVIAYYDSRILYLENLVKNGSLNVSPDTPSVQELMNQHIIEFDHRYELLAAEIEDLKGAFMKLQSFTMDINKTLDEERSKQTLEPVTQPIEPTKTKKGRNNVAIELEQTPYM